MSKRQTNTTIWNRLRRGLAGILTLALLMGLVPGSVVSARAADAQHWAMPYAQKLLDWGVMRGDTDGALRLDDSITRAEFVTMMNRAYGYTRLNGTPFTDVRQSAWYYEDIDIAYNMGYFLGTSPSTAEPESFLTREQAAVLLARNMMLQGTVGETLGFSDSRTLSDWSRGLVGAAAASGLISGYSDGTFRPQRNITRGEVAALLSRAIGTPVQTKGDHSLGSVYGNVTVNTAGVTLRDGIIAGNLYLTGGIDLGDVLLENVTVLGEIIVSGAGESHSSDSSVVLRNVTARAMTVDSISEQFVTIRAEGNTDIASTTVRTNAYVDDSTLTGYGLHLIELDGGALLQLAGNIKEVLNRTPGSDLQVVQGSTAKITVDEYAAGSKVLVDGDARVDELNLDVGTEVTGDGDIKDLNVGSAGSSVATLPDNITIRPGVTTDVNGSTMNSSQAAESSADPRLLAGYPAARNVAPESATLVFSVNKAGTIYWAVSAVADGSVGEEDLITPPAYGGKSLQSGSITAASSKTEYTAAVSGLAMDGSYYISAILVDSRGQRSPVKVTAFTTPDGTVPAFVGNPTQTYGSTKEAQVTGMPNKSCLLYWALLPEGAAAPTPAEFKANAVRGNLGYGSVDVTKNVNQSIKVNRGTLQEKTNYVAYLWLTDHDGAQSSSVYTVPIVIPDETPPEVHNFHQTGNDTDAIEFSFTMNETGRLHWAIVTDEMDDSNAFIDWENDKESMDAKIKVIAGEGAGAIKSGTTEVTAANTVTQILMEATKGLDPDEYNTSNFVVYYVGEDAKTPVGNYSVEIGRYTEAYTKDTTPPTVVRQWFNRYNESDDVHPLADTDIHIVFSESVQSGSNNSRRFIKLYQEVKKLVDGGAQESNDPSDPLYKARKELSDALYASIRLYAGSTEVASDHNPEGNLNENCVIDYRYAEVTRENGQMTITFPHEAKNGMKETIGYGANLQSGTIYHFELNNIYDCAASPNPMPNNTRLEDFRTAVAEVSLKVLTPLPSIMREAKDGSGTIFKADEGDTEYGTLADVTYPAAASFPAAWTDNPPQRIDRAFLVDPLDSNSQSTGDDMGYDILIWADSAMEVTLYSRLAEGATAETPWELEGTAKYENTGGTGRLVYRSLFRDFKGEWGFGDLNKMEEREYAIHVDRLYYGNDLNSDFFTWNKTVQVQVSVVAGPTLALRRLINGDQSLSDYNAALAQGASSIGVPDPLEGSSVDMVFTDRKAPNIVNVSIVDSDRYPEISVYMDRPGSVNFLLIPLTSLRYNNGNSPLPGGIPITDSMIKDPTDTYYITNYSANPVVQQTLNQTPKISEIPSIAEAGASGSSNPATQLVRPTRYTVTDGYDVAGTVRGKTDLVPEGTAAKIDLEGLDEPLTPNTIYFLCLVPQGVTTDSVSTQVYGWRFTTQTARRPVVTLANGSLTDGSGAAANVQVNTTAAVWSILVNENMLSTTPMTGNLTLSQVAADKQGDFKRYMEDVLNLTANATSGEYSYTILQALQDSCTWDTETPRGSVFDYFASATLKERVRAFVQSSSEAGAVVGRWNSVEKLGGTIPANRQTLMDYQRTEMMSEEDTYICFTIARTDPNDDTAEHGFRALRPVELQDSNPPRIVTVSTGNLIYSSTLGITGQITVQFDKVLYLVDRSSGGSELLKLAPSLTVGKIGTEYCGLGGKINDWPANLALKTSTALGPQTSLTVTASIPATPSTSLSFSLPDTLCSRWSKGISDQITITYNPDSDNAGPTGFVVTFNPIYRSPNYYVS